MNEQAFAVILFLMIIGIPGIVILFGFLNDSGYIHGKWIKRAKIHDCHHPARYIGEDGDVWQCRKCGKVWRYERFDWR